METKNVIIPAVEKILTSLEDAGHRAYAVGGCVRDAVMGRSCGDYDVTTDARPDEVKRLFSHCRIIETGIKHGTVTVVVDGTPVEITTFRFDGDYKDNRHPEHVTFSCRLEDDLSRRDFTVNALCVDLRGEMTDLFDGMGDIDRGLIRAIGDPVTRFCEDALRVMRALRFASVFGFEIEEATSAAVHKTAHLLKNISAERIFVEFKKLLCGKNAYAVIMEYFDVLTVFMPEIKSMEGFLQHNPHHCFDVLEHTAVCVKNSPDDVIVRLAAFFHDCGKPDCFTMDENGVGHFYSHAAVSEKKAALILERLKCDNHTKREVCLLIRHHDGYVTEDPRSVKRRSAKLGEKSFLRLLELQKADAAAHSKLYSDAGDHFENVRGIYYNLLLQGDCMKKSDLKVDGNDMLSLGYSGRSVGLVLSELFDAVLDDRCKNERDQLLELAEKLKENIIHF